MADRRRGDDRGRERRGEGVRESRSAWWRDETPVAHSESLSDPDYEDYDPGPQVPWGPGYIGEGNYSSGEFGSDALGDYDYGYGGFKGDAGIDEIGDEQYGAGRYGVGPFEQSDQYGGGDFRSGHGPFGRLQREFDEHHLRSTSHRSGGEEWLRDRGGPEHEAPAHREFAGPSGWRDAPDWADPAGFHTFRPGPGASRAARGPKGYRRSDERILEEIYLQLLGEPHIDSSDVSIEVHEGVATLTGTVPHRRMKHAIEDLAHQTWGVTDVDNRIRVRREGDEPLQPEERTKGSQGEKGSKDDLDPAKYSSAGS
jgi:hypothetical protein